MAISIYQCDACKFTFERAGDVEACPDCGSNSVRDATASEQADYKRMKSEVAAEQNEAKRNSTGW